MRPSLLNKHDTPRIKLTQSQETLDESGLDDSFKVSKLDSLDVEDDRKLTVEELKDLRAVSVFNKFKKKICIQFIPAAAVKDICCCGRPESAHQEPTTNISGTKWDLTKHIKDVPTNAYGEIEFSCTGRKTRAQYIRIASDSSSEDALKLMLREWKLEFPRLLISVTGGAKSFSLPPKLQKLFKRGLAKVAQTTGAWVITGGTNTGVMKHVGEALQGASHLSFDGLERRSHVYCIGIATWGIICDRKKLVRPPPSECPEPGPVKYLVSSSQDVKDAYLDANHTHFFLVDHGMIGKYGGEIAFRGRLERSIMAMRVDKNRGGVPAVQLVLEGGPNTIKTVYEAITNAIPVVVIKGSGRAADLLAFAHTFEQGEGPLFEFSDVVEHQQLLHMIEKSYPEMDASGRMEVYKNVLKCVENKKYITVYEMEDEVGGDIDVAILLAFLKGQNISAHEQLRLAMLWNRVDIARSHIQIDLLKDDHKEEALMTALAEDKPEFVGLLLEHGVDLQRFLTNERLADLYSRKARRHGVLRHMLGDDRCRSGLSLKDVTVILKMLIGTKIRFDYSDRQPRSRALKKMFPRARAPQKEVDPFFDLFVWAVLCNMPSMAQMFWGSGDKALSKGLIARHLFLAMAQKSTYYHLNEEIAEGFLRSAEHFGMLSLKLLDVCVHVNEEYASQLVTANLDHWDNQTCINIAVASNHMDFVAHRCCQELLSKKWTGAIQIVGHQAVKVCACLLMPPGLFFLTYRSKQSISHLIMTEEEYIEQKDYEKTEEDKAQKQEERELRKSKISHRYKLESAEVESQAGSMQGSAIISGISGPPTSEKSAQKVRAISSDLPFYMKIKYFYQAPVTKFWANVLVYIFFLLLFAYVIESRLRATPKRTEWLLVAIVSSLFTEELRQLLQTEALTFRKKVKEWASNRWNLCDAMALLLFFVGFGLRMSTSTIIAGHVVYAIDLMLWIIRLLDIFSVDKNLGPYVVMIGRMMIDMLYFVFILLVFLLAFGTARHAILQPYNPSSWKSVGEVFFVPYFTLYGELFLEKPATNPNETIFKTPKFNGNIEWIVSVLLALYLLISNILLLNVLIAKFNNTFTEVHANSRQIWSFYRYSLVQEFSTRPFLVPPFLIVQHMIELFKVLYRCCTRSRDSGLAIDRRLKFFPTDEESHNLLLFEEECLGTFLRNQDSLMLSTQDEKLRLISERVNYINSAFSEYKRDANTRAPTSPYKSAAPNIESKLASIEQCISELTLRVSAQLSEKRGSTQLLKASFRQVPRNSLNYQRSVSEAMDTLSTVGSIPATPGSLPTKLYRQQPSYLASVSRVSATSLPTSVATEQPRKLSEKSGMVKKAAYKFKKGSFDAGVILENRRSVSLTEEPPLLEQSCESGLDKTDHFQDVSTGRRRTFPSRDLRPVVVKVDESLDSKSSCDGANLALVQEEEIVPQIEAATETECAPQFERSAAVDLTDVESLGLGFLDRPHVLARTTLYPLSDVRRFLIPDDFVPWTVPFPEYKPHEFTAHNVLAEPVWADPDIRQPGFYPKFNQVDRIVNRKSNVADYEVVNGLPRNPCGRTGLQGRGLLGRYGPNHFSEPIITRWQRSLAGPVSELGLDFLEVLVVVRSGEVLLPSGLMDPDSKLPLMLHSLFLPETLESLGMGKQFCQQFMDEFKAILANGSQVYCGYLDDPRNTDNAWLETYIMAYHDESGSVVQKFLLSDKAERLNLQWVSMSSSLNMRDDCLEWLEQVACMRRAHFDNFK